MAAQRLHDLNALGHRRAEVPGAMDQVALVQVVGADAITHQLVHQIHHDVGAVIDARHEHGLRPQRDASIGQFRQRHLHLRRDLLRVVEVDVHPQGMELAQHRHQVIRDALGQEVGHAGADADDLDVGDGAQRASRFSRILGGIIRASPPESRTSRT